MHDRGYERFLGTTHLVDIGSSSITVGVPRQGGLNKTISLYKAVTMSTSLGATGKIALIAWNEIRRLPPTRRPYCSGISLHRLNVVGPTPTAY